jgi:glycerophosphoryl diester phosphodiesterase
MRRLWRSLAVALLLLVAFVYVNNTSLLAKRPSGPPTVLAHRGIAQQFDTANLRNDTCTASRMLPPTHSYLENTIPSMQASFEVGADIVEVDVHPTTDGQFAVFHDWTLDCRTNGSGVTREHSMAELKTLDIGYGYTADGGKTFPFRGSGIGLMPSLEEVLAAFPTRRFMINVKSRDRSEGERLAAALGRLPPERRALLLISGGEEPVEEIRRRLLDVRTVSRGSLKACLLRYAAIGWTGTVPEACRNMAVLVPINIAPWLWGWPDRFLERMSQANSEVFALGPYGGGEFSTGIDTVEDLARLPANYSGGVWTNEVELVAGALKEREH